jgi:hypothetical protein
LLSQFNNGDTFRARICLEKNANTQGRVHLATWFLNSNGQAVSGTHHGTPPLHLEWQFWYEGLPAWVLGSQDAPDFNDSFKHLDNRYSNWDCADEGNDQYRALAENVSGTARSGQAGSEHDVVSNTVNFFLC